MTLARAHYELGVVLEQRGEMAAAITSLQRAAAANATYAEPYYALARIFRRQGQKSDADAALATFERLKDAAHFRPAMMDGPRRIGRRAGHRARRRVPAMPRPVCIPHRAFCRASLVLLVTAAPLLGQIRQSSRAPDAVIASVQAAVSQSESVGRGCDSIRGADGVSCRPEPAQSGGGRRGTAGRGGGG